MSLLLIAATVLFLSSCRHALINAQTSQFVEKHSFQPPFLQFGADTEIPYWSYGGSASATENYIRLTPATGSRLGWLWNDEPVQMKDWEVILEFDIHNTVSPGADGIAFWYSQRSKKTGVLVGQEEGFEGIGIIFDTYDNNANGDSPSVVAIRGQAGQPVKWDYDNDFLSNQLARCRADIRNAAASSVKAKIIYRDGSMSVSLDTVGRGDYTFCFQLDRLNLPQGYYFGLTAATGGLSDFHDIIRFETFNLGSENGEEVSQPQIGGRKKKRFDPYEFYERELEKLEKKKKLKLHEEDISDDQDLYDVETPKRKKRVSKRRQPSARKNLKETRRSHKEEEINEQAFFDGLKAKMKNLEMSGGGGGSDDEDEEDNTRKSPRQKSKQKKGETTHVAFSNEAVMYIMDGLEQVTRVVRDSSTRQDINDIIQRVEQVAKTQGSVSENISGVGRDIKGEVSAMSSDIAKRTTELTTEISRLQSLLQRLEQKVHGLTERQGTLQQDIQRTTDTFRDDIRKESSFTFWIFFILFQIVFFAAMIFWKRMRDSKTKWLD